MVQHVYQFYTGLMDSVGEERAFSLPPDLLGEDSRISEDENRALKLTFTSEELYEVLMSMKPDSALELNGLPVMFFKKF
jgi:hypothetical protein